MVDEHMGLFGATRPMKGHHDSFGHMGSRRDPKPPKDATIHDGDLWSP
jgi:hypothetical protein